MSNTKQEFRPDEQGKAVSIIGEDDFIVIPCDKKFDGKEFKNDIKEYIEGPNGIVKIGKSLPKDIIFIPGRRNNKRNATHHSQPTFSDKEHTTIVILKDEKNINKQCYTVLYDEDENIIMVKYGRIVRGNYVDVYDENKQIIGTLAT